MAIRLGAMLDHVAVAQRGRDAARPTPTAAAAVARTARRDHAPDAPAPPRPAPADALGSTLAACVRRRTLQRYMVNPLPTMRHQWRPGLGLFFDPNCGWYAQIAAMRQRAVALNLGADPKPLLPKSTWYGFDPNAEGQAYTQQLTKPTTGTMSARLNSWETKLTNHGPLIVSGKLGGADWGFLGGVGHYILIVGTDRTGPAHKHKLEYMDPLQGNAVRSGRFSHLDARINDDVYRIDDNALRAGVATLPAQNAPAAGN